jgi:ATP-dependent RNA helicase RhlE
VRAQAQTGSGKTVAFVVPLLEHLQMHPGQSPRRLRGLVLVPTRELAAQVGEVIRSLAQHLPQPVKVAVLFGGVSVNPQMMGLRGGADIAVATPGRLLDLVAHNALRLSQVEMLVMDEADRLLDLGFADEVQRVLALLPPRRQTLLFSATLGPPVQALAGALLQDPVLIEVPDAPAEQQPAIVQRVVAVDANRRTELLRHLIQTEGWQRVLVFVATQYAAQHVAWKLYKAGLFATPFHGGMAQGARTQVLAEFKAGRWDVVVTTDLAARGIDITELPVVVNYDLPRSATDYLHRIGRTGRAGHGGLALSFVSADTEAHMRLIEKRQQLVLPREQLPGFEPQLPTAAPDLASVPGTGGIKGKRPSKKDKLRAAAAAGPGGPGKPPQP